MPDTDREREWLDSAENETSPQGLPRPDLNPLVNPLLGEHMGRWAEVYFTSPPEEREQGRRTRRIKRTERTNYRCLCSPSSNRNRWRPPHTILWCALDVCTRMQGNSDSVAFAGSR